jgi:hypothetical protein
VRRGEMGDVQAVASPPRPFLPGAAARQLRLGGGKLGCRGQVLARRRLGAGDQQGTSVRRPLPRVLGRMSGPWGKISPNIGREAPKNPHNDLQAARMPRNPTHCLRVQLGILPSD